MFKVTAQFEDTILEASSNDGKSYDLLVKDALTGVTASVGNQPWQVIDLIMRHNLDPSGEPQLTAEEDSYYEDFCGAIKDWPIELRPIP